MHPAHQHAPTHLQQQQQQSSHLNVPSTHQAMHYCDTGEGGGLSGEAQQAPRAACPGITPPSGTHTQHMTPEAAEGTSLTHGQAGPSRRSTSRDRSARGLLRRLSGRVELEGASGNDSQMTTDEASSQPHRPPGHQQQHITVPQQHEQQQQQDSSMRQHSSLLGPLLVPHAHDGVERHGSQGEEAYTSVSLHALFKWQNWCLGSGGHSRRCALAIFATSHFAEVRAPP